MEISLTVQTQIFFLSVLFGIILGMFYDVFVVMRIVTKCDKSQVFFQDIIYFAISGLTNFTFILAVNNGEVRFFIILAEILGWILYYITVGKMIVKIVTFVVLKIRRFLSRVDKKIIVPIKSKVRQMLKKVWNYIKVQPIFIRKNKKNLETTLKHNTNIVYNLYRSFNKRRTIPKKGVDSDETN